jgi:proteasome alpha subunit
VALIIAGIENGTPRLYETDPSGTPYEWKALAIGAERNEIRDHLEEHYREDIDLDGGIELALEALASVEDEGLTPEGIGVATIDVESEEFEQLSDDERLEYIEEFDLLADEDDEPDLDEE